MEKLYKPVSQGNLVGTVFLMLKTKSYLICPIISTIFRPSETCVLAELGRVILFLTVINVQERIKLIRTVFHLLVYLSSRFIFAICMSLNIQH